MFLVKEPEQTYFLFNSFGLKPTALFINFENPNTGESDQLVSVVRDADLWARDINAEMEKTKNAQIQWQ